MELEEDALICGPRNISNDTSYPLSIRDFRYYFDGVLVSSFGILGLIGNILTLLVLSRPKFRDCFHQLLLALACFDTVFIVFAGISYSFRAFEAGSVIFTVFFPWLIHPLSYIGMFGSIFMTSAISIERFLGICYPLKCPPHTRKSWYYIIPVTLVSILSNIPRFLESSLRWKEDGTISYATTELRTSKTYIKFFKTYFLIPFSAILPFLFILFLNIRIIWDLKHVKAQRFGSNKKLKKEINLFMVLLSIVVAFLILHAPRIIVDVYEFMHLEDILLCQLENSYFRPSDLIKKLTNISHFTAIINSGINFLIYSFVGNSFRREFCRMIGFSVHEASACSQRTVMSEVSTRSSPQERVYAPTESCRESITRIDDL